MQQQNYFVFAPVSGRFTEEGVFFGGGAIPINSYELVDTSALE